VTQKAVSNQGGTICTWQRVRVPSSLLALCHSGVYATASCAPLHATPEAEGGAAVGSSRDSSQHSQGKVDQWLTLFDFISIVQDQGRVAR
jgi:hypothetical protein